MFTENKTTELKREYVDDIKNTAIAFANCDGGTLYVGIEDDGTVCGVEDADGTMLRVTNAIREELDRYGVEPTRLSYQEKMEVVRSLDEKGIFLVKGAITELAAALKTTEVTIYRYISKLQQ